MLYKDEVIILKGIKYKDNDKILHAYSKKHGKIQIISRGCRKSKSKFIGASNLFAHSECVLYKNKGMYILNSVDVIDSFYKLRENIELYCYGCYILELIYFITHESNVDNLIFDMTVKVLRFLEENELKPNILIGAYELKLISMLGYKPNLERCLECGTKLDFDSVFNISEGGFYCNNCKKLNSNGKNMKYNDIITMGKILKTRFENLSEISNINNIILFNIRDFLFHHIGKTNFVSLKMINEGDYNG